MTNQLLKDLLSRFKQNQLTDVELETLLQWLGQSNDQPVIEADIQEVLELQAVHPNWTKEKSELLLNQLLKKRAGTAPAKIVPLYKHTFIRIAAAIAIVLVLGTGAYLMFNNTPKKDQAKTTVQATKDIAAPVSAKAIITLAGGERITLDSAANGSLAQQGNVNVVKLADGQIVYSGTTNEVVYNTLTNPKGSRVVDITLSDGSRVWLNAGSAITYPVAFAGNTQKGSPGERNVFINGEAYFEVTHNADMPFKVSKGQMEVTVLGTHFNVNAYDDDKDIRVTLLEGSVSMQSTTDPAGRKQSVVLKPGEQAVLTHDPAQNRTASQLTIHDNVDLDQVMAWKSGLFNFKGTDIDAIMKQVARWYNVEVEYRATIKEKFHVEMSRNTNVSNVFRILEATGGVHFKIDDKKIIVIK